MFLGVFVLFGEPDADCESVSCSEHTHAIFDQIAYPLPLHSLALSQGAHEYRPKGLDLTAR